MKLDIIIPVGPGHQSLVNEALQSVRMACLTDQGPFKEIKVKAIDDTKGEMGRSKARNTGIKASKADWLFFLDADDLMHVSALSRVSDLVSSYGAVWGKISELHNGCILERYQFPIVETLEQLISIDPYYTLQMGFFVEREAMPLFDESMDTGEDWKVYLNLWKNVQCIKIGYPLMVNRRGHHSEGPRSATGRQWSEVVHKMLEDERSALG